jgi:hypothetical protein
MRLGRNQGRSRAKQSSQRRRVSETVIDVYKPLGAWKVEPNSTVIVSGNDQIIFEYASPKDVPGLMQRWLGLFQACLSD